MSDHRAELASISKLTITEPEGALKRLERIAEQALPPLERAMAEKIHGTIHRLKGDLKAARGYYASARILFEQLTLSDDIQLAREAAREDCDLERRFAALAAAEGDKHRALEHASNAARAYSLLGNKKLIARAWSMRGGVLLHFKEAEAALEWYARALPHLHDDPIEGPPLTKNLNYALRLAELPAEEIDQWFTKLTEARLGRASRAPSRAGAKRQKFASSRETLADARVRLGQAHLSMRNNQFEDALLYLGDARRVFELHSARIDEAITRLDMAECEIFFSRWDRVREHASAALKLIGGQDVPQAQEAARLLYEASLEEKERACKKALSDARPLLLGRR